MYVYYVVINIEHGFNMIHFFIQRVLLPFFGVDKLTCGFGKNTHIDVHEITKINYDVPAKIIFYDAKNAQSKTIFNKHDPIPFIIRHFHEDDPFMFYKDKKYKEFHILLRKHYNIQNGEYFLKVNENHDELWNNERIVAMTQYQRVINVILHVGLPHAIIFSANH